MKRFVAVKAERYTTSKQCLRIYKDHFALQNACWEIPKPLNCIRWMQAVRF